MNRITRLTECEIKEVRQVMEEFRNKPGGLTENFADMINSDSETARATLEEIESGIKEYYVETDQYKDSGWAREKLEKTIAGKSLEEQGKIIFRQMEMLAGCCAAKFDDSTEWHERINAYRQEIHMAEQEGASNIFTQELIDGMKKLLMEQYEECALLITVQPEIFAETLEKYQENKQSEYQAVILDTQETILYLAAAVYALYRNGSLPSFNIYFPEGTEVKPWTLGVAAAYLIESDKVKKQAAAGQISLDALKSKLKKLAVVAVGLFVAYISMKAMMVVTTAVSMILGIGVLSWLVLDVLSLAAGVKAGITASNAADKLIAIGAKILPIAIEKAKETAEELNCWIKDNILQKVCEWYRIVREFVQENILNPIQELVEKAKDIMNTEDEQTEEQDEEEEYSYEDKNYVTV